MASLRVFSALNMVLWLGGTRSANATQSRAFRATRRPAILTLWEVEENLFSPDKNFHYKTSSTSISNTFHWLSLFPMDGGFPCLTSTIIIIIIIMIIVMMITNIIIRSVLSKLISLLVKLLVLLGLLLSPTPSLQVHGYFELCCCWLIV